MNFRALLLSELFTVKNNIGYESSELNNTCSAVQILKAFFIKFFSFLGVRTLRNTTVLFQASWGEFALKCNLVVWWCASECDYMMQKCNVMTWWDTMSIYTNVVIQQCRPTECSPFPHKINPEGIAHVSCWTHCLEDDIVAVTENRVEKRAEDP